ncbi:molybdopterin molybdotransferase MoeA [Sulfurisoma sediminicola]|uniref:Molybdopterin molybdenumtransferase n=1 Tax=Sulfurisoma sediminicola TaxID=1381557 RepID=A0A497X8X4_9PROT|nr:gephyrin-like molybdotransferase Glp [Sulfurisoma sediminicola]RLJ62650.1 molybdopterin molybdotransferase [Sulfurisoma sediminicola]
MNKNLLSFDEALERLLAAARPVAEIEQVPLLEADGRVLAAPLVATLDVPPLDNSAMDGYALRCSDVLAAGARLAVTQRIPAGSVGHRLEPGTAARIFTGAPVPEGADAVVMQERCERHGDDVVVNHVPREGENIRGRGEDIAAGSTILAAGTRLTPQALGLAASIGLPLAPTFRRLRIALFFTGDELAMPGEPLKPGAIYNSNRYVLRAALERLGCAVTDLGIVPDTLVATREALRRAAAVSDLIVTSGGVSVGEEDHVKPAVEAEGELGLWKLAIKPGKPLAFGRIATDGGGADFIGLPGNPVSSFVTFLILVRPFILKRMGATECLPQRIALTAGFDWPRPDARREFLRVRLAADGRLELFPNQGSGVLTSTVWAGGLVDNPAAHAVRPGDTVQYIPYGDIL